MTTNPRKKEKQKKKGKENKQQKVSNIQKTIRLVIIPKFIVQH